MAHGGARTGAGRKTKVKIQDQIKIFESNGLDPLVEIIRVYKELDKEAINSKIDILKYLIPFAYGRQGDIKNDNNEPEKENITPIPATVTRVIDNPSKVNE